MSDRPPSEPVRAPAASNAPALAAEGLCLTIDGRVALEGLDFETRGDRVLLVGDWSPLVAALGSGEATLKSGSLVVMGRPLGEHRAICGVAPHALPLEPRMTLRDYVAWAARLRGHDRRAARARADAVTTRLGIEALATRRLDGLAWPEQKAAFVAQALAGDPALLVVETPFVGLDPHAAIAMVALLGRATQGRSTVITTPALASEGAVHALASAASDLLVLHDGALALHCAPSDLAEGATIFAVTAIDGGEALQALLVERGAEVSGPPGRFTVRFAAPAPATEILAAARSCDAAVIGCEPLFRR
jgi:ABC-type multidrug transport system ATPase subunit